ncbi:hypothetical protein NL463_29110, partial [Klebsiella pneumoniae]|nr:hypothetical protein [Klebsiella pneumoniae]
IGSHVLSHTTAQGGNSSGNGIGGQATSVSSARGAGSATAYAYATGGTGSTGSHYGNALSSANAQTTVSGYGLQAYAYAQGNSAQ